jgi:hypothetical protein
MKNYHEKKKAVFSSLVAAGFILSLGHQIASAEQSTSNDAEQVALETKVKERLAEIETEARAADREKNGYYVERKSYGTRRETEPPSYVKQANKTLLKDYDAFENLDWLDIGLDYLFLQCLYVSLQ